MPNLLSLVEPPRNDGGNRGVLRLAARWLGIAGDHVLGPTEGPAQRLDVIRRAVVAATIIVVLPIQQMQIPGWPAVFGACVVALSYDVLLAYLVFAKKRYFVANVWGLALDALVLMGASFYVFREMGAVGSTSAIWLVFIVYIVVGGFTLAPLGSLAYTGLWTCWFALATMLYFPSGSLYYDQLPIRLTFLVLIGVVSLAMANELQRKRTRLEQQNRQTMGMLATLVEARDTDAGSHLQTIQRYSRALALRLGFSNHAAEEIAQASMMHDVGKANIPDSILKKPGSLTLEDWRVMQEHTTWGDQLLAEHHDFELARIVARSHHERWDGSGYPDGLAGKEIPLVARIVAVADVYDALVTRRPYKDAWSPEEAIAEVQRISGTHLDPQIAAAFVDLWTEINVQGVDRATTGENGRQAVA